MQEEEKQPKKKRKKIYQLKIDLKALTPGHQVYLDALASNRLVLCAGKAGTGKTFMAMGHAAGLLARGEIGKIIITRPIVDCGKNLGALPGDMGEKVAPYMFPIFDALEEFLGKELVQNFIMEEKIQIKPLEYMRGSSFRDSFIILDEAQNATKKQIKMFLTRFTKTCRVVVTGDAEQSDLIEKVGERNAFASAMSKLGDINEIALVKLTKNDIVRDELISIIDERLGDEFN